MPFNLIKIYNDLLELAAYTPAKRKESLKKIFDRDIANNSKFSFRNKAIKPTPKDREVPMETLYSHLTTEITDKKTRKREFDMFRAVRLHWVKHHIEEKEKEGMLVFSAKDKNGFRTYIYDERELYVIVLEPGKKTGDYFLLSAYHLRGKNKFKIKNKYNRRRLEEVL